MIAILKHGTTPDQAQHLIQWLKRMDLDVHLSEGKEVTILGLIYLLYQRECFVSTTLLAGSLFTVWVCGKGLVGSLGSLIMACAIAVVVGLIAVAVAIALIRKNGGKLREVRIFSADCSYAVLFAVCALCALIIAAVIFMPTLSFYLTWALVVLLFAELAYYTVKMM